jgi:hypothetical protein
MPTGRHPGSEYQIDQSIRSIRRVTSRAQRINNLAAI